jgi:hypothetical protein
MESPTQPKNWVLVSVISLPEAELTLMTPSIPIPPPRRPG